MDRLELLAEKIELLRAFNAIVLYPILKCSSFRFSKSYRHGDTTFHKIVYTFIDTPGANILADTDRWVSRNA